MAHAETIRQLTAIRDAVTTVVAADTARGSLEDEVAKSGMSPEQLLDTFDHST